MQFKIITNNGIENYKSIECYDSLDDNKIECFANGLHECLQETSFGNDDTYDFVILHDILERELIVIVKEDWKKIQIESDKISIENRDYSDGGTGMWEDYASQKELEVYRFG